MKKILTTPIKAEDLQDIRVGDVLYLTGTLVTCRDVCHRRLIELKRPILTISTAKRFSTLAPSCAKTATNGRWYPSARQPVCVWKVLNVNLSNRPA